MDAAAYAGAATINPVHERERRTPADANRAALPGAPTADFEDDGCEQRWTLAESATLPGALSNDSEDDREHPWLPSEDGP